MSATDEILAGIDPGQLAAALGTDEATAMNAAAAAIPTLIGGLQANSASGEGASSLLQALGQHAEGPGSGERIDLDAVDTEDGRKIVAHTLADDPQRLQAVSGLGGDLLARLLPLLAPIVLNYLARKLGMGSTTSQAGSGDALGDLLGGFLGGSSGAAAGGGLGDILGQVLGGQGAPGGRPAAPGPIPEPESGGVFRAPDNPGRLQIPVEDTGEQQNPQPQAGQGSGNVLGDLLGQILGNR